MAIKFFANNFVDNSATESMKLMNYAKRIYGNFDTGLDEVLKLQPINYRYNKDNPMNLPDEGNHIGFSAQKVQKVIPEAVTENSEGYLLVNNDPIMWAMLNAIKELMGLGVAEAEKIPSIFESFCAYSSEAAARSIQNPTSENIDALIEKIINKQISADQFVNADITFKEINQIKKLFKKKLVNIHHARIEY